MVHTHTTAMRKVAAREREELITQLRAEGQTFEQIGRQIGVTGRRANQIWVRVSDRAPVANVNQYRENEKLLMDTAIRELLVLSRTAKEEKVRVEAWNAAQKWSESRRKLLGLDAPARKEINVLTPELVQSATEISMGRITLLAQQLEQSGFDPSTVPGYLEIMSVER